VRISVAPHRVALLRISRGLTPRVIERKRIDCDPDGGSEAALEALRELLAQPNIAPAPASVVLSSHFVRYLVLPWSAQLVTPDDELGFAGARCVQVFGGAAQDWVVRLSPAPAGRARLAAAADRPLGENLSAAIAASPLKLVSLQPALMAQFNAARRTIGDDAWLVLVERGRLLIAWIAGGEWRSVRARAIDGGPLALAPLLEQERRLLSAGVGRQRVLLALADELAVDASGLALERLGDARTVAGGYALAGAPA
jgi:hypothetical protein